ncbi:S-adenosyl-L-methionine-dependent methyltransferase [Aspergillus violaceofuscus CBS 115571]|uniref:S-adenosyl-L-methionine-dependent methyltransferase n=1 Tax=Aspergillus violaceofuscus (strain CBS 115571) TaxID=1450538 RepID=A0A2V5HK27_ASPV1|nr:S-adenosyl-L-methionine-dependent methyltransferase [Aspergillus violaceofuscus CBS 115571]
MSCTATETQIQEREDFYDSPYLAEHYDLFSARFWEPERLDVPIYLEAFKQARKAHDPTSTHPFIVLDVGTGSGRVLSGLVLGACQDAQVDLADDDIEFVGLDVSPHMLSRAAETRPIPRGICTSWVLGSALDLRAIPLLKGGDAVKVDFLVFAAGGIAHLVDAGQTEAFLREVAAVLQPGSGRAFVSFMNAVMDSADEESIDPVKEQQELPSGKFPGIVYRTINASSEIVGKTHIDRRDILVIKKETDGSERVLERNTISTRLASWSPEEFAGMVQATGLEIVDTIKERVETYYALKLRG